MIRLLYNYYEDKEPARKKEIDFCLRKNLANESINTVIFETKAKPNYSLLFDTVNKMTGPDDINIIGNSDIFFDFSIGLTTELKHGHVWALSRWEWHSESKIEFSNRQDSQDVWIFRGPMKTGFGDFTLGIRGCDNRIAHEFTAAGYKVSNPSKSVRTYHVHNSGIRNYTMKDVVPPPYLTLPPTSL